MEENGKGNEGRSSVKTKVYHITFHELHRLAYLFFWGCNFSCRGCIRKVELFDHHGSIKGEEMVYFIGLEEIVESLKPFEPEIALFGGWEPTLDHSLSEIASILHTELETWNYLLTNGYELPIIEEIDEVRVSIKAYSDETHRDYTGRSNRRVLENFKMIYESGVKLSAETVLIPGYVDSTEVGKIARFISSVDDNIPLRIDAYWPAVSKDWVAPSKDEMRSALNAARKYLKNVSSLTGDRSVKGEVIRIV